MAADARGRRTARRFCDCCKGCILVIVNGCEVCVRCDLAGQFPAVKA